MALRIRNWRKFQYYKKRNPPWIMLYTELIDYGENGQRFNALPETAQAHLVKIFLLAARLNNELPEDEPTLRQAIRAKSKVDIGLLTESGWLLHDACNVHADCMQSACSETETKTETDPPSIPPPAGGVTPTNGSGKQTGRAQLERDWQAGFEPVYRLYWRKGNRKAGERAWAKLRPATREEMRPLFDRIKALLLAQTEAMEQREPNYRPHIGPWLNAQKFTPAEVQAAYTGG